MGQRKTTGNKTERSLGKINEEKERQLRQRRRLVRNWSGAQQSKTNTKHIDRCTHTHSCTISVFH